MTNYEQIIVDAAAKNDNIAAEWKRQYETLRDLALPKTTAKRLMFNKSDHIVFAWFDALDKKDVPNNINQNSIYVCFTVNLFTKKVELHSNGHVYLSPKDKATRKYKYYAMKSVIDVLVDKGGKKFRKQTFKDMADLFKRMENFYKEVIQAVTEYTGGYPYKQGIEQLDKQTEAA